MPRQINFNEVKTRNKNYQKPVMSKHIVSDLNWAPA